MTRPGVIPTLQAEALITPSGSPLYYSYPRRIFWSEAPAKTAGVRLSRVPKVPLPSARSALDEE